MANTSILRRDILKILENLSIGNEYIKDRKHVVLEILEFNGSASALEVHQRFEVRNPRDYQRRVNYS